MRDDFFEPKLKDKIVSAEEILKRKFENSIHQISGYEGSIFCGVYSKFVLEAMEEYANQFKKK